MHNGRRIQKRKAEHLTLCATKAVEFRCKRTWLEHIELIHGSIPACDAADVSIEIDFLGRRLAMPFIIGAMTGGTPEAGKVNRQLAEVATTTGVGLALGSQRPMLEQPAVSGTYRVRDIAPGILILGNIGIVQAGTLTARQVRTLVSDIDADGICLHLNSAMEMAQTGGDKLSEGSYATIRRMSKSLGERLVVKETGCGMSRDTAVRLAEAGVRTLDVAGAGGTSWVKVENLRRGKPAPGMIEFEEWGIPTAASLLEVRGMGFKTIASGGLRGGVDLAKAIALGAHLGSAALPILRALKRNGISGTTAWIESMTHGLRTAMVLTGCTNLQLLRRAPVVISGPLLEWVTQRRLWRKSLERR